MLIFYNIIFLLSLLCFFEKVFFNIIFLFLDFKSSIDTFSSFSINKVTTTAIGTAKNIHKSHISIPPNIIETKTTIVFIPNFLPIKIGIKTLFSIKFITTAMIATIIHHQTP